jgi:hypothetical protein
MNSLTTDLPVELWTMIIRFTLGITASLDSSLIPPLQCRTPACSYFGGLCGRYDAPYSDVITTRGSCMRVSKQWRAKVKEIAGEWIHINDTSGLESLERLMRHSMGHNGLGQDAPNLVPGATVKRIDYRKKDFESGETTESDDDVQRLFTIIRSCPNLVVLNAFWDRSAPP